MDSIIECSLCPRKCRVDRSRSRGRCGATDVIEVSKTMLHIWEEPPISGKDKNRGSGAVFFTHCPLGCVYCQNGKISHGQCVGQSYTPEELAREMLSLEEKGAYNINCVSPTHYSSGIAKAVAIAKENGLSVPIVWNTSGYELPDVIRSLDGVVDIFLTDFKYASAELSSLYSCAPDYSEVATHALRAMYSLVGKPQYDENSVSVLRLIADTVPPSDILLSLMAQYTPDFLPPPDENCDRYEKIRRKITTYEYDKVAEEAVRLGFNGFMQERSSATTRFTPDF